MGKDAYLSHAIGPGYTKQCAKCPVLAMQMRMAELDRQSLRLDAARRAHYKVGLPPLQPQPQLLTPKGPQQ